MVIHVCVVGIVCCAVFVIVGISGKNVVDNISCACYNIVYNVLGVGNDIFNNAVSVNVACYGAAVVSVVVIIVVIVSVISVICRGVVCL